MKDKVQLETTYPHPPERVWAALTDPAALSKWLMPTNFQPLIGFRFRLDKPNGGSIHGRVVGVEEHQQLAFTWDDEDEGQASLIVWTLRPTDGGTTLRVEHVLLEEPAVTRLPAETYFNWLYALRHGLPGMLRLLAAFEGRMPRPPIVYVEASAK